MEFMLLGGLGAILLIALFMWLGRTKNPQQGDGFTGNVGAPQAISEPLAASAMTNTAPAYMPTRADLEGEVRVMLAAGNKIEAVRLVRERTSMGLKEAKDLVDAIDGGIPSSIASLAFGSSQSSANIDVDSEARRLVAARRMIDAIKLVRERTGLGLKEAKDYVERL